MTPLRRCLDVAAGEGLIDGDLMRSLVLPSRRGGRRWAVSEQRFLTRVQLGRLLTEIPPAHQPLYVLLASTGLRRPAAERAGVSGIGLHPLRHTCASLLIEEGASPLRLQRWMGHHAAAYTLETYGHLINDELGSASSSQTSVSTIARCRTDAHGNLARQRFRRRRSDRSNCRSVAVLAAIPWTKRLAVSVKWLALALITHCGTAHPVGHKARSSSGAGTSGAID